MIIECFRCNKEIERANNKNADYIIAEDTIVDEPREIVFALKHNKATLEKEEAKAAIGDSEYDRVKVQSIEDAVGSVKILREVEIVPIQKTGIICPDDFNPSTDFVIWGAHKGEGTVSP